MTFKVMLLFEIVMNLNRTHKYSDLPTRRTGVTVRRKLDKHFHLQNGVFLANGTGQNEKACAELVIDT